MNTMEQTLFGGADALPEHLSPHMAPRTRNSHIRKRTKWHYARATEHDPRNELYYYRKMLAQIAAGQEKKDHPFWYRIPKLDASIEQLFTVLGPHYHRLRENKNAHIPVIEQFKLLHAIEDTRKQMRLASNTPNLFLARMLEPLYFMLFWDKQALYNACLRPKHEGGLQDIYTDFATHNYKYWERKRKWYPVWIGRLKVKKIGEILVHLAPLTPEQLAHVRKSPVQCTVRYIAANPDNIRPKPIAPHPNLFPPQRA